MKKLAFFGSISPAIFMCGGFVNMIGKAPGPRPEVYTFADIWAPAAVLLILSIIGFIGGYTTGKEEE